MSAAKVSVNKSQAVRNYIKAHPRAKNATIAEALRKDGVEVNTAYVANVKHKKKAARRTKSSKKKRRQGAGAAPQGKFNYPRHSLDKVLRIPKGILEQNAGKECTVRDAARFLSIKYSGPFSSEISSAIKFGLLERPSTGKVAVSDLAKQILRPQESGDELKGLRDAVLKAPVLSDVYNHYRGENLPGDEFFGHALADKFGIPRDKVSEFSAVFTETLQKAKLLEEHNDKFRVVDFSAEPVSATGQSAQLKKLGKSVTVDANDSCFVMMPFAKPHGDYYSTIYEPAISKAGLRPVRADNEIFGAGKIMDQVWSGIASAKVLVAEMTTKNANVFYELGLAHALKKPVVLVSSNEEDVPFDLQHIRVIYYDVNDPFWGQKLLEKVAENILSAIQDPEEAIFKGMPEGGTG